MIFSKGAVQALALLGLVGSAAATRRSIDGACPNGNYLIGTVGISATSESVAMMAMSQDNSVTFKSAVSKDVAVVEIKGNSREGVAKVKESLPEGSTLDCDFPQYVPETIAHPDRKLTKDTDSKVLMKKDGVRGRMLDDEVPYGITMVQALDFADVDKERTVKKVCVVDTGYDNGHEDLPQLNIGTDGFNPQSSGEWYIDGHGHGSHCAGTIGAIGTNGLGVTSVNPDYDKFNFFIGKGLSDSGSGSSAGVIAAVNACVENGASVVSMSLGGGGYSSTSDAVYTDHFEENDVLIIAAAGNSGNSDLSYPASYKAVMSVAAVDSGGNKAGFSQYNEQVEIAGPGVGVKSTISDNKYASWSGTSMATPHVAGVATLVWSYFPECEAYQIRNVLLRTAKDEGDVGCDINYGYGIVQARDAYDLLEEEGCAAGGDKSLGPVETIGGCLQLGGTYPPTPAPTQCDGGLMELEIVPDSYPGDISWEVKNSDGDVLKSGAGSGVDADFCLPCEDSYKFELSDSYGDGLCCSYGQGYYKVHWNGELAGEGAEFTDSASVDFEGCDGGGPTSTLRISAFQVRQKERDNGKLKTRLFFRIKNNDDVNVEGAQVTVVAYSEDDDDYYEMDTCITDEKGRCNFGLKTYNPVVTPTLNVTGDC